MKICRPTKDDDDIANRPLLFRGFSWNILRSRLRWFFLRMPNRPINLDFCSGHKKSDYHGNFRVFECTKSIDKSKLMWFKTLFVFSTRNVLEKLDPISFCSLFSIHWWFINVKATPLRYAGQLRKNGPDTKNTAKRSRFLRSVLRTWMTKKALSAITLVSHNKCSLGQAICLIRFALKHE